MTDFTTKLKYYFTVEFTDGSTFLQDVDDISKIDPKRSAFYDVLNCGKAIKTFKLMPIEAYGDAPSALVDLTDGHFEINGFIVQVDDNLPIEVAVEERELIFYRQHQIDQNVTYELKSGDIKDVKNGGHRIKYFIGWQTNISGKNYQRKIGIE
jgi:hypothetical protein